MISRRSVVLAIAGSPLSFAFPRIASASDEPQNTNRDTPPQYEGYADFGGAWTPVTKEGVEMFAVEPGITTGVAEMFSARKFHALSDIESYFSEKTNLHYIDWFNANLAGKGVWFNRRIEAQGVESNFQKFWAAYLAGGEVTLMEFLAYMAIFTNECSGNLVSTSEHFGAKDHAGIAYLFDRIVKMLPNGKIWSKRSYNTGQANRSAGSLFVDPMFNAAHGERVLGPKLRNTTDIVWRGNAYPQTSFPVSGDSAVNGYILEADFFKFRGRGLIQTTWRLNYRELVEFIQGMSGNDATLLGFKMKWQKWTADQVCTASSNEDWNTLFSDSSRIVLCRSIRQHAKSGYAKLGTTTEKINGSVAKTGSLAHMGRSIGGGNLYAATFVARMRETSDALMKAENGG